MLALAFCGVGLWRRKGVNDCSFWNSESPTTMWHRGECYFSLVESKYRHRHEEWHWCLQWVHHLVVLELVLKFRSVTGVALLGGLRTSLDRQWKMSQAFCQNDIYQAALRQKLSFRLPYGTLQMISQENAEHCRFVEYRSVKYRSNGWFCLRK